MGFIKAFQLHKTLAPSPVHFGFVKLCLVWQHLADLKSLIKLGQRGFVVSMFTQRVTFVQAEVVQVTKLAVLLRETLVLVDASAQ